MKNNQKICSFNDARQLDLVNYLSSLGYQPIKIRANDYWYLSPFRDEKHASFKVNRKLNCWYDHGMGNGGTLVNFGMLHFHCTALEFLKSLQGNFSLHQPALVSPVQMKIEPQIKVLSDFIIASPHLIRYLEKRKIPLAIADKYCREVRYEINGKIFYGIGFKTDSGSYEVRNPFLKVSSSPKSIKTIINGSKNVTVLEGFFDFLSYQVLAQRNILPSSDFIVLNSLSFFEKSRPIMEKYEQVHLYLDNDNAGQNCSRLAQSWGNKFIDESKLYKDFKDLNEWLVAEENKLSKRIGNRLR
jgi:hypothetical protein